MGCIMTDTKLRLQAELLSYVRQQEVIAELGQTALGTNDLQVLLDNTVRAVASTLNAEFCRILELAPDAQRLTPRAAIGWSTAQDEAPRNDKGVLTQAGFTLQENEPVVVEDMHRERRFSRHEFLHKRGITSGISVVIGGAQKPYGVIEVHTRGDRKFTKDDAHFVRSVSNLLAPVIERQRVEKEHAWLATIVASSDDAIVSESIDGRITSWNAGAERMYGYTAQEIVGKSVELLVPEERIHEFHEIIEQVSRGERIQQRELVRRRKDGREIFISLTASPIYENGRVVAIAAIARDITSRRHAEQSLKELNETLEQRIEERTRSLVESQQKLRSLASQLVLTEQRERRRLADELHDYLAQLLVASKINLARLRRMQDPAEIEALLHETEKQLNDSLNYTRTLVAELSPAVLYEAGLGPAVEWLADQMRKQELCVTVERDDESFPLTEDRQILVFQTIRELLFNVVKHAQTHEAKVTLSSDETGLVVTISDAGIGFDAANSSFEPSEAGQYGLFSIRERLEAIGGSFEIESSPGFGTIATLRVPRTGEPVHHSELESASSPQTDSVT